MKYPEALNAAEELIEILRPACTRIEIKGSLSRLKPEVKDIEILAVPDLASLPRPRVEFGQPVPKVHKTKLNQILFDMGVAGEIQLTKAGDRMKAFYWIPKKIGVDLFLVLPPADWGVQAVIRTGPADFSHWVVTRQRYGGALHNDYRVQDGALWHGAHEEKHPDLRTKVPMLEESNFLNFLSLGWIEPSNRQARWPSGRR